MALKVMVEAGIVGKFDASVRNTLEKPRGRPNRSLSKLLRGREVMGKLAPQPGESTDRVLSDRRGERIDLMREYQSISAVAIPFQDETKGRRVIGVQVPAKHKQPSRQSARYGCRPWAEERYGFLDNLQHLVIVGVDGQQDRFCAYVRVAELEKELS